MKKYPYEYTSSQLSKYFGITIKGIEYYEKKGLISPKRIGEGKKRIFDLNDTYRMFMSRYLEQSGFTLQKTLGLINSDNLDNVTMDLLEQLQILKEKQHLITGIIRITEHNLNQLESRKEKQNFEIIKSPELKRLFLREMQGPHNTNKEQTEEYRKWNELMPICTASLRYPFESLKSKDKVLPVEIGMIMRKDDFDSFGFKESTRVETITSKKCLHTVIIGDADGIQNREWLSSIMTYLRNHNLELNGDIITNLLFVQSSENASLRCEEVWVPIA